MQINETKYQPKTKALSSNHRQRWTSIQKKDDKIDVSVIDINTLIQLSHNFFYHSTYTVHRIHARNSSTESKYSMNKIINMSRCIELQLHKEAVSFTDYIDLSTLPQRIELIKSKFRRSRAIKSNDIIHQLSDTFNIHCDFKDTLVNE